jgi:hypothetical protein
VPQTNIIVYPYSFINSNYIGSPTIRRGASPVGISSGNTFGNGSIQLYPTVLLNGSLILDITVNGKKDLINSILGSADTLVNTSELEGTYTIVINTNGKIELISAEAKRDYIFNLEGVTNG